MSNNVFFNMENNEMWTKVAQNGLIAEAIISKTGQRITPHLIYNVSGLCPHTQFKAVLKLQREPEKQKYENKKWVGWQVSDPVDTFAEHVDGPKTGEEWMRGNIDFSYLMPITDQSKMTPRHVLVASMHVYQPTIHLIAINDRNEEYSASDVSQKIVFVTSWKDKEFKTIRDEFMKANSPPKALQRKRKAADSAGVPTAKVSRFDNEFYFQDQNVQYQDEVRLIPEQDDMRYQPFGDYQEQQVQDQQEYHQQYVPDVVEQEYNGYGQYQYEDDFLNYQEDQFAPQQVEGEHFVVNQLVQEYSEEQQLSVGGLDQMVYQYPIDNSLPYQPMDPQEYPVEKENLFPKQLAVEGVDPTDEQLDDIGFWLKPTN